MKLDVATNEVVLSNVGTTGEFKIRNSAKAFKILSDGLYSNKIRAIIRELSCNALDSHVAAGKADVPFEVHLPTVLEPWFAVKDFGLGLDNHQVINIYTTYFESTKTESNDFIGALGLGSKSPFSYTENFTVTAIKDGIQRIYSAFINEQGVPSITEMGECLTDEPNGVEVKFSVTDRSDYQSFRNEARGVFAWFTNRPIITGVAEFEHYDIDYKERNIVPGVHARQESYNRDSVALMGNIPYPLGNIPDVEKHLGALSHLLSCNLVIEFQIGELDFAASREQLSYIPLTINSIRKKLEMLNANLLIHLTAKADAIESEWERAYFLQEQYTSRLYKAAVVSYVNNTKFALFDVASYHGNKSFTLDVPDLEKRGLSIKSFRSTSNGNSAIRPSYDYNNHNRIERVEIPVEKSIIIVLNDLKTGCLARARYHYSGTPGVQTVICVSHSDNDVAVRQVEYDKLIKELHNPPVIMASTLMKQERRVAISTAGIAKLGVKDSKRPGHEDSYTWVPHSEPIDENVTYYYVALKNHTPLDSEGNEFPMFKIREMMDNCAIPSIAGITVFGVRKSRIKELSELDNWVWFEDKLKEEISKITDEHVASLVATEMLDSYYNKVYTNKNVAKMVGPDSDYAKYVDKYSKIKRISGSVTELVALCAWYGKSMHVDKVRTGIDDAKKALYKKYPLLPHISTSTPEQLYADYIMMVDKQEQDKNE